MKSRKGVLHDGTARLEIGSKGFPPGSEDGRVRKNKPLYLVLREALDQILDVLLFAGKYPTESNILLDLPWISPVSIEASSNITLWRFRRLPQHVFVH